ncbi:MAG: polysaccharide deacetylase family protein [Terriglobales bacterium]
MDQRTKAAMAEALAATGILRLGEAFARAQGSLVFALHRVLPAAEMAECYNPHLALTPESLDAFLNWVKPRYQIVSVVELLSSEKPVCCITFDDGWEDNFRIAFPILQKHRAPATIFLATGLINTNSLLPEERLWRVWQSGMKGGRQSDVFRGFGSGEALSYGDAQARFKRLPMQAKSELINRLEQTVSPEKPKRPSFMTWEQVRTMSAAGIGFGSHSVRHTTLAVEVESVIRQELKDSLATLQENIKREHRYLAYPNGSHDERVVRLAQELGYKGAFTTRRGRMKPEAPRFTLPRIPLDNLVVNSAVGRFSEARMRLHVLRESWPASPEFEY